jgi:hypothetical protein
MIRRLPAILVLAAAAAMLVSACDAATTAPALTDPVAILTAALKSTESAKSVHLDIAVDGSANVVLPTLGGAGTKMDLTGTTAAADVDFAGKDAKATFAAPNLFGIAGEVIAVDGKAYVKTTLTGPLYQESASGTTLVDPTKAGDAIDNLGDLLLKPGVVLTKGEDVACGGTQCYTVTTNLTAEQLGLTQPGAVDGLPVDLTGATVQLTVRVEKTLPNHLAGLSAVLTTPSGALKLELTASKWDQPVTITAPPTNQIKPAS